jgi:hypothetical protein
MNAESPAGNDRASEVSLGVWIIQSLTRATPRGRGLTRNTLGLIEAAYTIAEARQLISVRGICCGLFVQGLLPNMSTASTKRVSRALTLARERGCLPWDWIIDDSRPIERPCIWSDTVAFAQVVQNPYLKDRSAMQPERPLVMSEKETVGGILRPVLGDLAAPFLVAHVFSSATVVRDLADESTSDTRPLKILYVGDYDPSGPSRPEHALPKRLYDYGGWANGVRVVLLEYQLTSLPSFPVASRKSDTRDDWCIEHCGDTCRGLDALDPNILGENVHRAVQRYIDDEAWERVAIGEDAEMKSLRDFFNTKPPCSSLPQNDQLNGGVQ